MPPGAGPSGGRGGTRQKVHVMLKGFTHARLSCGCTVTFREGVEGSPVTVVVEEKAAGCALSLHVQNLPLFDYREALRPSTRLGPPGEEEYEEEG